MFRYGRMQKKIPLRLVCGSRGACLVNMLPGVQVTTGLGFFTVFSSFSQVISSKTVTALLLVGTCSLPAGSLVG